MRRWSGFVCPYCRFVFRVPRDHDGQGVICPGCRRALKIPTAQDQTQDLVIPLPAESPQENESRVKKRRKKTKSERAHEWDRDTESSVKSSHKDRRQMVGILIGGGVFLMLALAATIVSMRPGKADFTDLPPPVVAPVVPEVQTPVFSEPQFVAEAEIVAKSFLDATTVEELLPLLRHPELTEPRLRRMHPDGKVAASGMSVFNINSQVDHVGSGHTVQVRTGEFIEKPMTFFRGADGLKVDWESWVGWSDMPWAEFMDARPSEPKLFRVVLTDVKYYNFDFNDEDKWQSYRLTSPDGEHALFGYVESSSVLKQRLALSPDVKEMRFTLSLRYPEGATSANQVLIDQWHADGWVIENENEP